MNRRNPCAKLTMLCLGTRSRKPVRRMVLSGVNGGLKRSRRVVKDTRDEAIVSVACGWAFTLVLGSNGTVRVGAILI